MTKLLKLIHEENDNPLELVAPLRVGVHDLRAEMFLPFAQGKDILEIGCGYGYDAFLFSKKAKTVTGIDVNKKAIMAASKSFRNIQNLKFIQADALDFIAQRKKFDVIILFESLEHLSGEEQVSVVKKLWNLLRAKGQLFISTPNGEFCPFYRSNPYHKNELTLEGLMQLLSDKFEVSDVKGQISLFWFLIPVPWVVMEKIWMFFGIYEKMCKLTDNTKLSRTLIVRAKARE
jgi:2-polyprenyl-3-methyl-5-hydroxy-6-metoxy-1,4-benzoquinol methylase